MTRSGLPQAKIADVSIGEAGATQCPQLPLELWERIAQLMDTKDGIRASGACKALYNAELDTIRMRVTSQSAIVWLARHWFTSRVIDVCAEASNLSLKSVAEAIKLPEEVANHQHARFVPLEILRLRCNESLWCKKGSEPGGWKDCQCLQGILLLATRLKVLEVAVDSHEELIPLTATVETPALLALRHLIISTNDSTELVLKDMASLETLSLEYMGAQTAENNTILPASLKHLSVRGKCFARMVVPVGCSIDLFAGVFLASYLSRTWAEQCLRQVQRARVLQEFPAECEYPFLERFFRAATRVDTLHLFANSPTAEVPWRCVKSHKNSIDLSQLPKFKFPCLTALHVTAQDLRICIPAGLPLTKLCLDITYLLDISFEDVARTGTDITSVKIACDVLRSDCQLQLGQLVSAMQLRGLQSEMLFSPSKDGSCRRFRLKSLHVDQALVDWEERCQCKCCVECLGLIMQ